MEEPDWSQVGELLAKVLQLLAEQGQQHRAAELGRSIGFLGTDLFLV